MKVTKPSNFILQLALIVTSVIGQSAAQSENIITIDYCDLVSSATSYDKKIVRINAQYFVGFEASVLINKNCKNKRAWVEFDKSFEKETSPNVLKKFNQLTDVSPIKTKEGDVTYPGRAVEITLVGRFAGIKPSQTIGERTFTFGFGHLNAFDYELTVLKIEDVQELPEKK